MNTVNFGKIPHRCIVNLNGVYDNLKNAEKKAVDYLLDHPDTITSLTVSEFAEKAGCSEATIVRFSKRLGYEGYPELKKDFIAFANSGNPVEYNGILAEDTPIDIMQKVFESSISALQDTLNIINEDNFIQAVNFVSTAEKIVFTGLGDAGVVAMEGYQKFLRGGKLSFYSPDQDINLINASQLGKSDILVAISHSGRTKAVIDMVKVAKEKGAAVISITNFPVSVLTKKSDIVLQTAVFTKSVSGEVISKRLTALCIVESLYLAWFMMNQEGILPFLKESGEIVRINKYS